MNLNAEEVLANPYPFLAKWRKEKPMHWLEDHRAWCVLPYAECRAAFMDDRFSSRMIQPLVSAGARGSDDLQYLGDVLGLWMAFNDPPTHTRLRGLVNKAFHPDALERLRPKIAELADAQLDYLCAKGDQADFVRDFSGPFPACVIAAMLGVPLEDVPRLKEWSVPLTKFLFITTLDLNRFSEAATALRHMTGYFSGLVAQRKADPQDTLIDRLIQGTDGDDGLSIEEVVSTCVLLLFAGHETTTHFFTNGLRALHAHPEQWERLQNNGDDRGYVRNAVREILRWDGPSFAMSRIVREPLEFCGEKFNTGMRLYLFVAAANRDEKVFANPDVFDIERPDAKKYMTFGHGIHNCVGTHLVSLEGEVAWPRILERLKGWRVQTEGLYYSNLMIFKSVSQLAVKPHGA
jgi:cytochrome P450